MSKAPSIRFVRDRDGRRVAYAVHGNGPLLVLPAWWVSHLENDWEQASYRSFFEHVGEVATVVRYDRPGVGLSDECREERSLDDEVALLDAIISELDAPRVSLLGLSCGGPPAIAWAAKNPDRTDRLILFGAYAKGEEIAPPELREALTGLVRAHWGAGARALSDVFVPDATADDREAFTRAQRDSADAETAERYLRLTYAMDASALLSSVRAPTHVFHRKDDRAIPFRAGRALAADIPGARLVVLEGRIHPMWMGTDTAGLVVDVLRDREPAPVSAECGLDEANREVELEGTRVQLTPLEFGVLRQLFRRKGEVVTRNELLDRVWEQRASGSNVVDAVVRTLRKKLGAWSPSIETVTGHGYRFDDWSRK